MRAAELLRCWKRKHLPKVERSCCRTMERLPTVELLCRLRQGYWRKIARSCCAWPHCRVISGTKSVVPEMIVSLLRQFAPRSLSSTLPVRLAMAESVSPACTWYATQPLGAEGVQGVDVGSGVGNGTGGAGASGACDSPLTATNSSSAMTQHSATSRPSGHSTFHHCPFSARPTMGASAAMPKWPMTG